MNNNLLKKDNFRRFKHCLEITSSSTIKFIYNKENENYQNNYKNSPADGKLGNFYEKNYIFNPNEEFKFEENVNFFMVLHTLLNLNSEMDDFSVKGDLVDKIENEKFKVNYLLINFSIFK
jgi:hypothetical protein